MRISHHCACADSLLHQISDWSASISHDRAVLVQPLHRHGPRICSCLFHLQFVFFFINVIFRQVLNPTFWFTAARRVRPKHGAAPGKSNLIKIRWSPGGLLVSSLKNMFVRWMTKRTVGVSVSRWRVFSLPPQPIHNCQCARNKRWVDTKKRTNHAAAL